jgi:CHAD domain-containing protein
MAFRLKNGESVGKGIKRLARRQVEAALAELRSGSGRDEPIHDARKRFKRVRALLRLVRDELGEKVYRRENTSLRDAGRPLTEVRDAKVLLEALDALEEHFADQVAAGAFDEVRKGLETRRKAVRKRVLKEEGALPAVVEAVAEARDRLPGWRVSHKGWAALGGGLKGLYKQGLRATDAALADPSTENLHGWRKQAKYLWHQLQVLEPVWPGLMDELGNQFHELTQLLGDEHDLAVLRETVTAGPSAFGGDSALEALLALIDRRREELRQEAFPLGRRLYADRPKVFTARMKSYWKAWRSGAETASARSLTNS